MIVCTSIRYPAIHKPVFIFQPYNVRMGVIELVGHLLLKVYNEEVLTDQQKEEKESLFECLFDHLSDLTAFCRSRVSR